MYRLLQPGVALRGAEHNVMRLVRVGIVALLVAIIGLPLQAQTSTAAPASPASAVQQPDTLLQDRTFQSESLARSMRYRILLPADYFHSDRAYPALYLLHGWHGDYQNWSTLTKLTEYAAELPLIVVMPDAGDSWYVDSGQVPQDKFETYVVHDLVDEVDHHWKTIGAAHRRAIAGLSMGG